MNINVIRDHIVISKDTEEDTKTASGLVIVRTEPEKNISGTVLVVGSGRITMSGTIIPLEVSVGQKVVFNKNMATEIKHDGETVYVLREDQVLCILN